MGTSIKKHEFKTGLPQEFEVLDLRQLYFEFSEDMIVPHRAGFYHLIWYQNGNPTHQVDFQSLQLPSNSLLFVKKDCVHAFDDRADFDGKVILFTEDFFCKTDSDRQFLRSGILFNDLLAVSHFQIPNPEHPITAIVAQMEAELTEPKDAYQSDLLLNYLRNLLLLSEREHRTQDFKELKNDANLEHVVRFRDLLDAQFVEYKRVSHYADLLSVTEKRLNQATKAVLGKTPKSIIDERVLLEAKRLLVHTTESVKEIGFSLGFDEPTNFIKYFRKHTGITPAEFHKKAISE